jgi:hypothetical protein
MLDELPAYLRDQVVESKLEARNTLRAVLRDGTVIWRYHSTTVFTRLSDGSVNLNTGGWNTLTTRERMNMALHRDGPAGGFHFSVRTDRGVLYLGRYKRTADGGESKSWPFNKWVSIGPRGGGIEADQDMKQATADRKALNRYMKKWRATSMQDMIDASAGDPWVFPNDQGKLDSYIVRDWIDSGYCFAKLAVWALEFSGRGHSVRYLPVLPRDTVDQAVRRFLRACMGYASS